MKFEKKNVEKCSKIIGQVLGLTVALLVKYFNYSEGVEIK